MRSTASQLLVTLAATVIAAGFFIHRGPPPETGLAKAVINICPEFFPPGHNSDIYFDAVKRNLRWGVDPERQFDHRRPIHWAASHDDTRLLAIVLKAGADVDAMSIAWNVSLHRGTATLYHPETALHIACRQGNTAAAKMLLEAGADVSLRNSDGETALAIAKEQNRPDLVDLLRQYGAKE